MSSRRRSSLVAVHADKGQQEGSVPLSGILILLVVLAAIAAVWINEFAVDADDLGETTLYRTGPTRKAGGRKLHQFLCVGATSLKDCECDKVVSDALHDYVEKLTMRDDDSEEEVKPKKRKGTKAANVPKAPEPKKSAFDDPVPGPVAKKVAKREITQEAPKATQERAPTKPPAEEIKKAVSAPPIPPPTPKPSKAPIPVTKAATPAPTPVISPKVVNKEPPPPIIIESEEDEPDSGVEDSAEEESTSAEGEDTAEDDSAATDEGVESMEDTGEEEGSSTEESEADSAQDDESEKDESASDDASEEDSDQVENSAEHSSEEAPEGTEDYDDDQDENSSEEASDEASSADGDDSGISGSEEASEEETDSEEMESTEESAAETDEDGVGEESADVGSEEDSDGGSAEETDGSPESAGDSAEDQDNSEDVSEDSDDAAENESTSVEAEDGSEEDEHGKSTSEASEEADNSVEDESTGSEEQEDEPGSEEGGHSSAEDEGSEAESEAEESEEESDEEAESAESESEGIEESGEGEEDSVSEDEAESREADASTEESESDEAEDASQEDSEEEDESSEQDASIDDKQESTEESEEADSGVEDSEGDASEEEASEESDGEESEESEEEESEDSDTEEASEEASEESEQEESVDASEEDMEQEPEPVVVAKPKKGAKQPKEAPISKVVLDGVRDRSHIAAALGFSKIGSQDDSKEEKLIQQILKDIKKSATDSIKPLERDFKFSDISQRVLGDAEIFNKPMALFLGPWSSGKSTAINYLLGTHGTRAALKTGPQPTDSFFTVLHHNEEGIVRESGIQMAGDSSFSGVNKFGSAFLSHFRGIGLNHPLLKKVMIVDTPGIIDGRRFKDFPLHDVFQWFIDRADAIYVIFDPSKLEIGLDMKALLDQLRGREQQTRFLLNKGDLIEASEVMRVTGQLLWNVAPLFGSSDAPIIYTVSMITRPYLPGSPVDYFQDQEEEFLRHLKEVMDERVENTIMYARRHAVRVRNHAKLVDCYLEAYYKHKGMFGNKKKIADQIIKDPAKYSIFDTISQSKNVSKYDLLEPEDYADFFKLNPLPEFSRLKDLCGYVKGCPIDKLDRVIAYDLPQLLKKYQEKSSVYHDSEEDRDRSKVQGKVPTKIKSQGKSKSR